MSRRRHSRVAAPGVGFGIVSFRLVEGARGPLASKYEQVKSLRSCDIRHSVACASGIIIHVRGTDTLLDKRAPDFNL